VIESEEKYNQSTMSREEASRNTENQSPRRKCAQSYRKKHSAGIKKQRKLKKRRKRQNEEEMKCGIWLKKYQRRRKISMRSCNMKKLGLVSFSLSETL
jgi:hypothetical protein